MVEKEEKENTNGETEEEYEKRKLRIDCQKKGFIKVH